MKKVLALALVVALMMGFATIAGASDFSDDADIDHSEAVEVMEMIGVINGYPDGSFRPDGNVTRAQMATMVAYIVAGGDDVGNLYAGANTFSDCTTHWARGYIAYANRTGIIAGVGNGLFDPDGDVTGAEAAKMMLCALGYDQDTEEYVGTGWSVNALADARTLGLLDGLTDVDMNAALSRDDAAQLMFNALQATMVEYERGSIVVDSGDSTVTIGGSEAQPITNSTSDDYRTVSADRDAYVQMCEQYFEDLSLDTGDTDAFGRPAHTWTYGRDEIGTYVDDDAVVIYTASTDASDVRSDLRNYDYASDLEATVNSVAGDAIDSYSDVADQTADGTIVEVYANDDREITDVIVVETVYAEVSSVNDTRETFTVSYDSYSEVIDDDSDFYNLYGEVEEDDILAVCYADDNDHTILDLYVPESVTGNTTRVNNDGDTATVGGESITAAATAGAIFDGTLGQESVVYLSSTGYAIYVDAATSSSADYMYVTNIWSESSYGNVTWYARGVLADGTIETLEVVNEDGSDGSYAVEDDSDLFEDAYIYGSDPGEAITYDAFNALTTPLVLEYIESDSESGLYILVHPQEPSSSAVGVTDVHEDDHDSDEINVDGFRLASDVTFIYVTGDGDDIVVSTGSRAAIGSVPHQIVVEEVDDRNQGTVVFINSASAVSEDVYYISEDLNTAEYVDANGNTRTGHEVEYYAYGSDSPETMIVTNRTAVSVGFYTRSTAGEAYEISRYSTNALVNEVLDDAYGGVINNAYTLTDDAVVIDITDSGYSSVRALENLADDDTQTVKVSFTFDGSDMTVETVYIQSIESSDTSVDYVRVDGTNVDDGDTIEVVAGEEFSLRVSLNSDDASYDYTFNGEENPDELVLDSGSAELVITVTAEDGSTDEITITVEAVAE